MSNESTKTNQITEGVIWKQLLIFFFPIVVGTLFQQLYNTVDAVIVGRFVGKGALAAVGGSSAVLSNLIIGCFTGLASGASVIVSQFYGAKDERNLQKSLHTAYAFSVILSIVFTILLNTISFEAHRYTCRYTCRFYSLSADLLFRYFRYLDF